jgi:hypothetical protein
MAREIPEKAIQRDRTRAVGHVADGVLRGKWGVPPFPPEVLSLPGYCGEMGHLPFPAPLRS